MHARPKSSHPGRALTQGSVERRTRLVPGPSSAAPLVLTNAVSRNIMMEKAQGHDEPPRRHPAYVEQLLQRCESAAAADTR
ncbi:hypothetical protein ACFUIY_09120 [Streptomyces griseorubiginosus]|uniref:hypothetical protein n=1 Tax=Streptomyces griseorubiginosus TaxID=67304 RepID=UPI00113FF0D2|nr:hypothetical protein [Streptomyces griseorubiginosus]